jgi:hypothetical protein
VYTTNLWFFCAVLLLSAVMSGGLILGISPFISQMVREGYFKDRCPGGITDCNAQRDEMSPIYMGGFQIMTWGSCVAGLAIGRYGGRTVALVGAAIAAAGNVILATSTSEDGALMFMLGYGLVGMGGNCIWIPAFQVTNAAFTAPPTLATLTASHTNTHALPPPECRQCANLFARPGFASGFINGAFNVSTLVYAVLNAPGVTITAFYELYAESPSRRSVTATSHCDQSQP